MNEAVKRSGGETLLAISDVERIFGGARTLFGGRTPAVHAVQGLSLDVRKGETLGIVGESGCGKSTLARLVVGLDLPTSGSITFGGEDLTELARRDRRALARKVQYVFQDPVASLNPRKTIRTILEAPLRYLLDLDRPAREKRLGELMDAVNLAPEFLDRYPHEFSGGQAQRIGIARALAMDPELIIADEAVSALDVSIQAQVLDLLRELRQKMELSILFITHDLRVAAQLCDRIAVMQKGKLVEIGTVHDIFLDPQQEYTRKLLAAVPGADWDSQRAATA